VPEVQTEISSDQPARKKRRRTAHLKDVPDTRELREQLREQCRQIVQRLDRSQVFSKDELEESCRVALGGNWPQPGGHKNKTKTVTRNLQETVKVWGQCTGWANQVTRIYPAKTRLTCEDQSWFVPVP